MCCWYYVIPGQCTGPSKSFSPAAVVNVIYDVTCIRTVKLTLHSPGFHPKHALFLHLLGFGSMDPSADAAAGHHQHPERGEIPTSPQSLLSSRPLPFARDTTSEASESQFLHNIL